MEIRYRIYTMKLVLTIAFILSLMNSKCQDLSYPSETILSGGYLIRYITDDSMQYIYLCKDQFSKELSSCSIGLPRKNLGYISADFKDVFVMTHSFGPENPHPAEIIDKSTGDVLFSGTYIDIDFEQEYVLLGVDAQCIGLFNVKKNESQLFKYPKDITCMPKEICITIKEITDNSLIILYLHYNKEKSEKYRR